MTSLLAYHKQGPPRANDSKVSPRRKVLQTNRKMTDAFFFQNQKSANLSPDEIVLTLKND